MVNPAAPATSRAMPASAMASSLAVTSSSVRVRRAARLCYAWAMGHSLTLAAWLHDIDPFAIELSPGFGLRWYGLAYIAGFVMGWWMLYRMARAGSARLRPEHVIDIILTCVIGVLVGGRLGYVLVYQPSLLWDFGGGAPWWGVLRINDGGMASHGGMLGVILAALWIARREGVRFLHLTDALAVVTPIGLGFGRLANFVNGELLGKVVAAPGEASPWWSVQFPQEIITEHAPALTPEQQLQMQDLLYDAAPSADTFREQYEALLRAVQHHAGDFAQRVEPLLAARHPSQLYQFGAEGLILGLALLIVWKWFRKFDGLVSAMFLMVYGALRIVTEFWRLPDDNVVAPRIAGLSRGQWLSVLMIVVGIVVLLVAKRRRGVPDPGAPAEAPANDKRPSGEAEGA